MTWQPTEQQIEAAGKRIYGAGNWKWVSSHSKAAYQDHVRQVLIAAHAAADPVDTTEFEAALQSFARDVEVYGCIWYADDVSDVPVVASRAKVIDLYVKAATR